MSYSSQLFSCVQTKSAHSNMATWMSRGHFWLWPFIPRSSMLLTCIYNYMLTLLNCESDVFSSKFDEHISIHRLIHRLRPLHFALCYCFAFCLKWYSLSWMQPAFMCASVFSRWPLFQYPPHQLLYLGKFIVDETWALANQKYAKFSPCVTAQKCESHDEMHSHVIIMKGKQCNPAAQSLLCSESQSTCTQRVFHFLEDFRSYSILDFPPELASLRSSTLWHRDRRSFVRTELPFSKWIQFSVHCIQFICVLLPLSFIFAIFSWVFFPPFALPARCLSHAELFFTVLLHSLCFCCCWSWSHSVVGSFPMKLKPCVQFH